MKVYAGRLRLHENLFYATRELGRLYETGRWLHNYALTYALGLASAPYYSPVQTPRYAEQLAPLNQRGVYVMPGRGVELAYQVTTFKYGDNHYHVAMEKGSRNTPSFGRAREIEVGSVFEFAVLSANEALRLPHWVRLGLWRSKAHIEWTEADARLEGATEQRADYPLNPLDLPVAPLAFDLISMPPASLLDQVVLRAAWWAWPQDGALRRVPADLKYRFPG